MNKLLGIRVRELNWLERVWLFAPLALWFSYQPLVRLGQDAAAYYELSLAVLYIVALALVGLPNVWRARQSLIRDRAVQLVGAFVGLSLLSLLWTQNFIRGVLTVGIIGVLYLVLLACIAESKRLRKLLPALATVLVLTAVALSVLALSQVIAGIWLSGAGTFLCAGCTADQFGFARPNVFAIEPQFLGSLLLAPLYILVHVFLKGRKDWKIVIALVLVATALFLTLSRGAIFAFACGALVLYALHRRQVRSIVQTSALLVTALVSALLIQGVAAALNPRINTTFYGAVSASISQLSLNGIQLPTNTSTVADHTEEQPVFDGYVKESTDTRTSLTHLALNTWMDSPTRMLVGVGVGGSGAAMHEQHPDKIGAREIVQNEYVELLLEYGLLGLALFTAIAVGFMRGTRHATWLWAFAVGYGVQWLFFSGYPNALHVYLVLIVLYVAYRTTPVSARRAEAKRSR